MIWLLRNPLSAVLGGLSLLCFAAAAVQTWRLDRLEREHAAQTLAYQTEIIARQRAAQEALESYRLQEQAWAVQKAAAEETYVKALADRDRIIRDLRRSADELRNQAAQFAAGDSAAASDSASACRARAATLAELFSRADETAGRMAEAADTHAEQVRVLIGAWPR